MATLMMASWGVYLLSIALISVSTLLILIVLIQKNRGSGLSGAFGGVGGHTAFGTKTGDVMTWITVGLTAVFLLLSIAGTYVFEPVKKPAAGTALTPPAGAAPAGDTSPAGSTATPQATPAGTATGSTGAASSPPGTPVSPPATPSPQSPAPAASDSPPAGDPESNP